MKQSSLVILCSSWENVIHPKSCHLFQTPGQWKGASPAGMKSVFMHKKELHLLHIVNWAQTYPDALCSQLNIRSIWHKEMAKSPYIYNPCPAVILHQILRVDAPQNVSGQIAAKGLTTLLLTPLTPHDPASQSPH